MLSPCSDYNALDTNVCAKDISGLSRPHLANWHRCDIHTSAKQFPAYVCYVERMTHKLPPSVSVNALAAIYCSAVHAKWILCPSARFLLSL